MRDLQQGKPFHGEFSSADATALSEEDSQFTLYDTAKNVITLANNDQVLITDLIVANNTGFNSVQFTVYDGSDNSAGAGEKIYHANMDDAATSNPITMHFPVPHYCRVGTYPKMKTNLSGQVDAIIRGVILKHGF